MNVCVNKKKCNVITFIGWRELVDIHGVAQSSAHLRLCKGNPIFHKATVGSVPLKHCSHLEYFTEISCSKFKHKQNIHIRHSWHCKSDPFFHNCRIAKDKVTKLNLEHQILLCEWLE